MLLGGFKPVTPRSIVQRGTTEPTNAAAEPDSNLCYLCNNLDNAAVNFFHGDLHKKFAPTRTLLHSIFCQGAGREFIEVVPKGRAFSTKLFCHFWNFHHYGRNRQLTTLWGLFVALKLYTFKDNASNLRFNQS